MCQNDGSQALFAELSPDLSIGFQQIQLELILPGEIFVKTIIDPASFKNGPFEFNIEDWNKTPYLDNTRVLSLVKTNRKVEDTLDELGLAMQTALRQKSGRNIRVALDEAHLRALFQDSSVSRLMDEIAGLSYGINSLLMYGKARNSYQILVSGKGHPYLAIQEKTSTQANSQRISIKLTILPPKSTQPNNYLPYNHKNQEQGS